MPQFTSFPALQAETVDVPAIRRQAQQDRSQQTTDALNQARLQELQGAPGRRSQTQAMEKATKDLTAVGNMLQVVERAPPEQREQLFQAARQQAQAMGMDLSNVPKTYDGNWSRLTIARAREGLAKIKALPAGYQPGAAGGLQATPGGPADPAVVAALSKAKGVQKTPAGYQQTEGGVELVPGYLEGQQELATAKRGPNTALENVGTGGTFTIQTPEGPTQVQAYFDKRQGKHFYRDAQGNEQPLPYGAEKITPSSETFQQMRPAEKLKLDTEMNDLERGTRQIYRYLDSIGKGSQGLELLTDRWMAKFKTIFGPFIKNGRLDEQQLATLIQSGQLQGLLGAFRKEIVGGGVMTEQDALRVLAALGGDVSASRNKEVAMALLRDILEERIATYNEVFLPTYNRQGKLRNRSFKEKKRLKLNQKYFSSRGNSAGPPADEPGAVLEGHVDGKPVYKRPDGTYFQTVE